MRTIISTNNDGQYHQPQAPNTELLSIYLTSNRQIAFIEKFVLTNKN